MSNTPAPRDHLLETCKLCGDQAALVPRSHVVPQWMYAMLPVDQRRFRIASTAAGEFEQRSQSGIYGRFVCQSCENLFSGWDTYAADVLRSPFTIGALGREFGEYNYGHLVRFYLSILWRASACGHRFFETVDIRGREAALIAALRVTDDASLSAFDVWPSYSNHELSLGLLTPIEVQIESVSYWQLYLPRFQALIKVVDQPGASCVQPHKLLPDTPLRMKEKTFTEFGEVTNAAKVFKANLEKKNACRR
ncbi:MAG: hypothetical protein AB7F83_00195 [Lysobacterales bacterium]